MYRDLGEAAWAWVLGQVRGDEGPWLPEVVSGDEPAAGPDADRDSVYAGIGGMAPVLAEIGQYRALTGAEQALAAAIVARLCAMLPARAEPSLYDGLGGDVTALRLLASGSEQAALARLAELMTPLGWNTTVEIVPGSAAPVTDLIQGSAGVVLAAVWAGGEHAQGIAATGGVALLHAADQTEAGLDWAMVPGSPFRAPNYSHGTAGVATALAIAGAALGRADFAAAARQGAQHLLAVGSLDHNGFIVPHTLPHSTRDVDPVTYNWCHGPAGTSQLFAALALAGVKEVTGVSGDMAAATLPGRHPCLRRATADPAWFLGQRRPLLRHCRGRGRVARRRARLRRPGAGRPVAKRCPHDGRRPRRARDPRPAQGILAVHRTPPRPVATATGHIMDARRRRNRRLPASPGPGPGGRPQRPGRRPPGPVVDRPGSASHRPHGPAGPSRPGIASGQLRTRILAALGSG